MFSLTANDVYDVSEPLHFFSKIIGLTSCTIERKNGKFVSRKSVWNLLFVIFSTLWSVASAYFYYVYASSNSSGYNSYIHRGFEKSVYFIIIVMFYISTQTNWWIFFAQSSFCEILNCLADVDKELQELKVPVNLRRHKKVILAFVVFVKISIAFNLSVMYLSEATEKIVDVPVIMLIFACILMELGIFTIFHFIFAVWSIKLRYENINLFLMENISMITDERNDGNEVLTRIAILHDELVDASQAINRCYGVPVNNFRLLTQQFDLIFLTQIMIMTSNNFAIIILNIFSFSKFLLKLEPDAHATLFCVNVFVGTATFSLVIYTIVHLGHFTLREVSLKI